MMIAAPPEITSPVFDFLQTLHNRYAALGEGAVATYIPELAKAAPNWFGICVVTADGYVYEVGDSREEFTIQSISKPFVYGMALEDNTRPEVLAKIGMEPTGATTTILPWSTAKTNCSWTVGWLRGRTRCLWRSTSSSKTSRKLRSTCLKA